MSPVEALYLFCSFFPPFTLTMGSLTLLGTQGSTDVENEFWRLLGDMGQFFFFLASLSFRFLICKVVLNGTKLTIVARRKLVE